MSQQETNLTDPLAPAGFQTASKLIIAIDFGTTFTGVAYIHSGPQQGSDATEIAQRIIIIRNWPSPSNHTSDKTPSIIAYNTDPPTWGEKVEPNDAPQFAYFKLGLEENSRQVYRVADSNPPSGLFSRFRRHRYQDKEPVDFAADYLTCIYRHVREKFSASYLENQRTSYVITVPAIWSDDAKNLTRLAATRAGIPGDKLNLITEPEAAALYCATMCEEVDLKQGDRFLVCDAGGGTVVNGNSVSQLIIGSHFLQTKRVSGI